MNLKSVELLREYYSLGRMERIIIYGRFMQLPFARTSYNGNRITAHGGQSLRKNVTNLAHGLGSQLQNVTIHKREC